MKLLGLHVKRYGHFAGVRLDLDGAGFQLVRGPNEAGKTTLLEFVRDLLFGFGERNDYNFGQGRLEGEAAMLLASGQRVELRRRKGRPDAVSVLIDGQETPHDDGLRVLLGNASEDLFRSVFAFGLQELVAAEKGLAEQSVRSALYGGGLAGALSPEKVLKALDAEARALFKERAPKTVINALCGELKSLNKQVGERTVRCETYEQRRAELEQALADAKGLDTTVEELTREHSLASKLVKALPVWLEVNALRQERAGLSVPDGFPADGKERFDKLQAEIERLKNDEAERTESIAETRLELEKVVADPRVADRKAEIKHAQEMIHSVKEARRDLPIRERELAADRRDIRDELDKLALGWTEDKLNAFVVEEPTRSRLNELASELQTLEKDKTTIENERRRLARERRDAEAELERSGEQEDVSALAGLLEQEVQYTSDKKERIGIQREERKVEVELTVLLSQLNPPPSDPAAETHKLPVPARETIDQFKLEFGRIEKNIEVAQIGLDEAKSKLAKLEEELEELNSGGEVPIRERLGSLRGHRDAGWELIRRGYVAGEDVAREVEAWLAGRSSLPDAYEGAVREADRYADLLFDKSRSVAKQEEISAAKQEIEGQKPRLAELQALRASAGRRWEDLWRPCGFAPLDPEGMLRWLDVHRQLCALAEKRAILAGDAQAAADRITAFENQLREALGGRSGDAAGLLVLARQHVKEADQKEQDRRSVRTKLARIQDEVVEIEKSWSRHHDREEAWNERGRAVLRLLGFPEEWRLDLSETVIARLKTLQVTVKNASEKEDQIEAFRNRLDEFDGLMRGLCTELAPDLLDKPGEVAAAMLGEQLSAHDQRVLLEKNLAAGNKKLREIQRKLKTCRDQVASLYQAAGVSDDAAFHQVAEHARRISELDAEIAARERELVVMRENEPPDDFEQRLQRADGEVLAEHLRDCSARLEQARARKTAADQQVGACRQALADLERGGNDAADLQVEVASRRAQLAAQVDRFVPLLFARHLLQQAVQRFEKESQPRMLQEVSRIFRSITGDRYHRVERPLDDSAPLLIHRFDTETLEPRQLSTGTREQLYLAIRLAYVLHYCARAEPLPVVMDDVLANFDDGRARQTLRGLGELAQNMQIIMFTCHDHLVGLARDVFPDLRPIHIPPNGA